MQMTGLKDLYISSYCNPKTLNESGQVELESSLKRACNIKNLLILVRVDFNLPDWNWKTKSQRPKTAHVNMHQKFADILDDNGLVQIVEEPTRGENIC